MYFSENLKLLRKRKNITQDQASESLNMKRSTLSGYENGIAEPALSALLNLSGFYNISIDTLVKMDLKSLSNNQLDTLEKGTDIYMKGSELRVIATTIDEKDEENIELVPEKAKAGYATGFADAEYISNLPRFHLPFLSGSKKYRSFQVSGDSMLPITDGSWVTGEFVQDWNLIRSGIAYIILTMQDGIVFKMVENKIKENGTLLLNSLNPAYKPYEIHISEVREVWKFANFISTLLPEPNQFSDLLAMTIEKLKADVDMLKKKVM